MRIDRSVATEELEGARMDRRARLAPDDPDAASKDRDEAAWCDGPRDSSPVLLDSAVRTERAAAYRAGVDAAYGRPERRDEPAEVTELGTLQVPGRTTAATWIGPAPDGHDGRARDDVPTGARGPASGRDFDPEAAGGPIQQLDAGTARITNEGVREVAAHLQRFTGGGSLDAPEQGMLDRLTSITAGDMEPTSYDLNFYTHELDEAGRYAKLGFGPESGADLGSPDMYDVWNDVHTAALEDYRISGADLYYPGLAS